MSAALVAAAQLEPALSVGGDLAYVRPNDVPVHPCESRLAGLYYQLNAKHFAGELPLLPVLVGIPADADRRDDLNGLTRMMWFGEDVEPSFAAIYLSLWLFGPMKCREETRWRLVGDTLLHELVHVKVNLASSRNGSQPEVGGHGSRFSAVCNRIGRSMGWDDARPDDRCDGWADDLASEWPGCVNE